MTTQELKFDEKGLIPAVVQDFYTKKVLTVAYMNAESLDITLREKRKGETSGNVQHVVSVTADCDGDALVVEVIKDGPACHLGTDSCFANLLFRDEEVQRFSLEALYALLEGRNAQRPEGSYTTYLFENSDLCYHVLVLMVAEGITLDDIRAELASRHVIDHKVKQETMQ